MSKLEHEACLRADLLAYALHISLHVSIPLRRRDGIAFDTALDTILRRRPPLPAQAAKLTEDPPFGGLWCDQPAIFLRVRFGLSPRWITRRGCSV